MPVSQKVNVRGSETTSVAVCASRTPPAYIKPIGYKILLELLVICGCSKVVEVPITFRERAKGESKLNLREQMNYLNHLSRLFDFSHPQWSAAIKYLIVNVLGVIFSL